MHLEVRKQKILGAVVRRYVATAEPVGSESLAEYCDLGVKPATLRNEMAEMADLGYLQQPHTSAGRIPSEKGYRFYVDWLISPRFPSQTERHRLRTQMEKARIEVERVLHQTCRMLSALTHYISMATPPEVEQDVVRQVHLAALDRERLLVVLALATGRVEHAVMHTGVDLMTIDLGRIEYLVSQAIQGNTVAQVAGGEQSAADILSPDGEMVFRAVTNAVRDALARLRTENNDQLLVEGTSEVLHQPEFIDTESIRRLMDLLEERRQLFSLLQEVYTQEARVVIGSESGDPRMQTYSLVAARYTVMGRYTGTIGVLGPTRMDYDRAVPVVRFMARSVGEVLTKLSL